MFYRSRDLALSRRKLLWMIPAGAVASVAWSAQERQAGPTLAEELGVTTGSFMRHLSE